MHPHLCTTYDSHRPDLLRELLPYVGSIEVTPDSISSWHHDRPRYDERILADLSRAATEKAILVHGVGLSIGSADGLNETYLTLLSEIIERLPVRWHSEHLGFTTVDGQPLNAMLPLPRTRQTLRLLVDRINRLQDRYALPFLLENIAHLVPAPAPVYSEADFLNELSHQTGCGLILDLYNVLCDSHNYGSDFGVFLEQLDKTAVRELHLAGGTVLDNFWLDIHSDRVADETLDLAALVLDPGSPGYCPNVAVVTYEILPQAVEYHGDAFVLAEVRRLAQFLYHYASANVPA